MVDSSSILHFTRDRTLIPGPSGHTISGPDWLNVTTRLTAVEGAADTFLPWTPGSGQYVSPVTHGIGDKNQETTGVVQPDWVMWTPVWMPASVTANKMAVYVHTAAAGGTLTLGLYDKAGTLVHSFGTVTTDTTGWKIATSTSQAVNAGRSWLAVKANATPDIRIVMFQCDRYLFQDSSFVGQATPTTTAAGALPASMSASAYNSVVPHIALGIA